MDFIQKPYSFFVFNIIFKGFIQNIIFFTKTFLYNWTENRFFMIGKSNDLLRKENN